MLLKEVRIQLFSGRQTYSPESITALVALVRLRMGDPSLNLVVRDIKILETTTGGGIRLTIHLPDREFTLQCPNCESHNVAIARHCNFCGKKLPLYQFQRDKSGRPLRYVPVVFTPDTPSRLALHKLLLNCYECAREKGWEFSKISIDEKGEPGVIELNAQKTEIA